MALPGAEARPGFGTIAAGMNVAAENGAAAVVKPCTFCAPTETDRPHFAEFGRGRIDLVPILETDNLQVLPDALPVSPDGLHMLVIPHPHKYSFAANPDLGYEVGHVLRELEERIGQPLAIFEHGG